MSRARWAALLASIFVLLALIAAYLALHKTETIGTLLDGAALRVRIEQLGAWGPLAIIALMMLSILMSPIPSAPIAMAAGALYGHAWGTLYVVAGAGRQVRSRRSVSRECWATPRFTAGSASAYQAD